MVQEVFLIKKYTDKLQKANNIPCIPKQRGINVLTYFNRPAHTFDCLHNHPVSTNADAN